MKSSIRAFPLASWCVYTALLTAMTIPFALTWLARLAMSSPLRWIALASWLPLIPMWVAIGGTPRYDFERRGEIILIKVSISRPHRWSARNESLVREVRASEIRLLRDGLRWKLMAREEVLLTALDRYRIERALKSLGIRV